MVLDTLTWACLLLAPGAETTDVWHMNTGKFQIPIRIQPSRRNEIKELQLYVSRDQGKTWDLFAKASPDKDNFTYLTADDGLYWFSVAVVDQNGQLDPRDIMKAPVGQKIVVDTKKPEVRVSGERQGEEVQVRWDARDEYPDFSTLKLEYRTGEAAAGLWTPVPATLGPSGLATVRPGTAGPVTVQVQLKDLAGNLGQAQALVAGSGGAPPMPMLPGNPGPVPPGSFAPVNVSNPAPIVSSWNTTLPPGPSQATRVPDPLDTPPGVPISALPTGNPGSGRGAVVALAATPPANLVGGEIPAPAPRPGSTTRGTPSDVKIVNKRQIKLDFDVVKSGPSGLGSVDVYVTTDDGQTWERQSGDAHVTLPPGIERSGTPVRGSVAMELAREAMTYGFTLIVKSRAGLGKAPPKRGDLPQLRVEMDTTLPEAVLFSPQADPARPDTLILTWKASDRNLTENPITLEWAERQDGSWSPIGSPQLPNSMPNGRRTGVSAGETGEHRWTVPANVPPSVYLRLTVRDTAGNSALAQTSKPILVDLTVPELGNVSLSTASK